MAHLPRHSPHAHVSSRLPAAQPGPQRKAAGLGRYAAGDGKTRPAHKPEAARLLPQGRGLECGSAWQGRLRAADEVRWLDLQTRAAALLWLSRINSVSLCPEALELVEIGRASDAEGFGRLGRSEE